MGIEFRAEEAGGVEGGYRLRDATRRIEWCFMRLKTRGGHLFPVDVLYVCRVKSVMVVVKRGTRSGRGKVNLVCLSQSQPIPRSSPMLPLVAWRKWSFPLESRAGARGTPASSSIYERG